MALVSSPVITLAAPVVDTGTFTLAYPAGTVQADFTSANASATAIMQMNGNDRLTEVDDDFDISYGASLVTVTNKTGVTWPTNTTFIVGCANIDGDAELSQSAAIVSLTDNSTGTASNTIAAGVGIQTLQFQHTFIAGTAAVEPVTGFVPGFKFKILSWNAVTSALLVGASGSRVANLEIGTTDVGTVPSTVTIPIANAALGTVTAGTTVTGANTGSATDAISIEIATGGTAFSAGSVTFNITLQNMDTADAIAALAAKQNATLVGLRASDVIVT